MIRNHRVKQNLGIIFASSLYSLPGGRHLRKLFYHLAYGFHDVIVRDNVHFIGIGKPTSQLQVGRSVLFQSHVTIDCSGGVEIADNVVFSRGATLYTHAHRVQDKSRSWRTQGETCHPIRIETDVWVGAHAIILPGVALIGRGAIIGAGSVVTKDVAPHSIIAGNPARVVGQRQ